MRRRSAIPLAETIGPDKPLAAAASATALLAVGALDESTDAPLAVGLEDAAGAIGT